MGRVQVSRRKTRDQLSQEKLPDPKSLGKKCLGMEKEWSVELAKGSRIPVRGSWEANIREMCSNLEGSKCRQNSILYYLEPSKPPELQPTQWLLLLLQWGRAFFKIQLFFYPSAIHIRPSMSKWVQVVCIPERKGVWMWTKSSWIQVQGKREEETEGTWYHNKILSEPVRTQAGVLWRGQH